jgi:hypothetical protein
LRLHEFVRAPTLGLQQYQAVYSENAIVVYARLPHFHRPDDAARWKGAVPQYPETGETSDRRSLKEMR